MLWQYHEELSQNLPDTTTPSSSSSPELQSPIYDTYDDWGPLIFFSVPCFGLFWFFGVILFFAALIVLSHQFVYLLAPYAVSPTNFVMDRFAVSFLVPDFIFTFALLCSSNNRICITLCYAGIIYQYNETPIGGESKRRNQTHTGLV